MNHPPKQLALLISLIGAGVSPLAHAAADVAPVDAMPTLPGLRCTDTEAIAIPECSAAAAELTWQPQRSPLDLSTTPGVLVLYKTSRDDWAPGETETFADAPALAATRVDDDAAPVSAARAEAPAPKPARTRSRRLPGLTQVVAKSRDAAPQRLATLQVEAPVAPRAAVATGPGAESESVYEGLIAALSEPVTPPAPARLAAVARAEATARPEPAKAEVAETPAPAPIEAVDSVQTTRVLAQLGAVLVKAEPETFAPVPTVAVTQSDKVLSMLRGITAPQAQPAPAAAPTVAVEDGPAKRARKLAERAAKAEAKAVADAVAAGQVDVLLPLETHAALPADVLGAASAMTEEKPTAKKRSSPFGDTQVAVASTSLDKVRGGFDGGGLSISFGIERAVYINGALQTTTTMNINELGQAVAGKGVTTLDSNTVALIQNGSGNTVATGSISPTNVGTVIQNTLDGQKIQNVTVINATANSLGIYRAMNLGSSLRGAVIDSLRR